MLIRMPYLSSVAVKASEVNYDEPKKSGSFGGLNKVESAFF
jgi:hypothetical protein